MVISCDNCGSNYTLKDDSIPEKGARTTCKSCKHVIMILPPQSKQSSEAEVIPDDPTQEVDFGELSPEIKNHFDDLRNLDIAGLNALELDFSSIFIKSWKVKVKFGLVYDFSDFKTLQRYMKEGKVVQSDVLSYDGKLWIPMNVIPSLEEYFCRVYMLRKLDVESGLFSEDDTIARGISKKSPEKANVGRAVTVSSGLSDLSSVLAEAEAEVDGRDIPSSQKRNSPSRSSSRSNPAKKKGAKKSGKSKTTTPEPTSSNSNNIFVVVGIIVVGIIAFMSFGQDDVDVQNTNSEVLTQGTDVESEKQDTMQDKRDQLQSALAAKAQQVVEKEEQEKKAQQLIAQVPQEVLDAQRAQQAGVNTVQPQEQSNQKTAKDYASDGAKAIQKADWNTALSHYLEAVKMSPNNSEYNERVGFLYFKKKQYNTAKPYLQKSIQLPNPISTAYRSLGYIAHEEGDDAGRNQYFNLYLKTGPADSMQIRKVMNGG